MSLTWTRDKPKCEGYYWTRPERASSATLGTLHGGAFMVRVKQGSGIAGEPYHFFADDYFPTPGTPMLYAGPVETPSGGVPPPVERGAAP